MKKIKNLIAFSMIGAPLLLLMADTNSLIFEYPKNFWFGSITMFLSFYAFLGLIHGTYHLSNCTKLALIGTMIAVFGALAGETIMGLERVAWAMHDAGIQEEIKNTVQHPLVFSTSRQIGLAFPIGLIILSVTMFKAKAINSITLILLIVGILLFPVGRIVVGPYANVPGDVIMLVIYGKLGVGLLKQKT